MAKDRNIGSSELKELFDDIKKGKLEPDLKVYLDKEYDMNEAVRLSEAVKRRHKSGGRQEPYTLTKLSASNIEGFKSLIPVDIMERIRLPRVYGIGILTGDYSNDYTPVGVLIFNVSRQYDSFITIEWLHIKESERHKGYGTALFEAFTSQAYELKADSAIFDLPATLESKDTVEYLAGYGFSFSLQIPYSARIPLSELKKHGLFNNDAWSSNVAFLKDISDPDIKKGLQVAVGKASGDSLQIMNTDISWYDQNVSTIVTNGSRPVAFLLIHRCPSGIFQIMFMGGTVHAGARDFAGMLKASADALERIYGPDSVVEILFRSENGLRLLDHMYLEHQVKLIIRAGICL